MATLQADGLQVLLNKLGVKDSVNSYPSADVLTRPLDIYRSHLAEALVQFTECEPQVAYDSIQELSDFGDLEVVVPRLRIKGSNPKDLAFELAQKFPETPLFDQPFEDGIHVRLYISPENLARILLPYVLDRGNSYGSSHTPWLTGPDVPDGAKARVIVEFSSPNLGKEFDGAHMRSTIIGSSIASFYEGMGWDVCRMNFLGDWGKHVGLLAVGWSMFGSDERLEVEPLRHLLSVYTNIDKISKAEKLATKEKPESEGEAPLNQNVPIATQQDEFFKKMEDGDSDALALWERLRNVCVTEYAKLYAQLNISFDDYSGESQVSKSTIAEVEAVLTEKGVYEDNNGAWIIDFNKHGSKGLGTVNLRQPNGTTGYLLRDVGAVLERRKKYNFDKMVYVVSARQDMHFQQLVRTLELMGDKYHKLAHALQHVNFTTARGLSPQPGNSGLLLGDILEQCRNAMQESLQSSGVDGDGALNDASEFARLAVMSQELSTRRSNTSNFTLGTDEKIAAPLENYPGLRLQRWLDSLRSEVYGAEATRTFKHEDLDYTLFEQEEAYADMLRLIARFPNIAKHAFERLDPSIIFSYLLQIIEMLPSVWDDHEDEHFSGETEPSVEPENEGEGSGSRVAASQDYNTLKLAFYDCIRTVLENGMVLIGLVPIKERKREPVGTDTALPQEVSEDATPTAKLQELSEETTLSAVPQKDNDKAADVAMPEGVHEAATEVADPEDVNEEAGPTAIRQEDKEGDELTAIRQEDKEGDELTTMPQVIDQKTDTATIPEENNEKTDTATVPEEDNEKTDTAMVPEEDNEKTDTAMVPEEDNEKLDTAMVPEEDNEKLDTAMVPEEDSEKTDTATVPEEDNEQTDTATVPEKDNEKPALSNIAQGMTEAAPGATLHGINEDAALTAVPGEVDMEIASTSIPHEVNRDTAIATVSGDVGEE